MKNKNLNQALLLGVAVFGAVLLTGTTALATIVQTVNQTSSDANGWASAIWGSPAATANNSNDYETTNTYAVRTPNNSAPAAFAGRSLTVDAGGILYLKHSGPVAAGVNLIMNGGKITFHGGTAAGPSQLSGAIQVLADSIITSDQTGVNTHDIGLQSPITGSGNFTVTMATNYVILSGNNSAYSGNWTNNTGYLEIISGATNALGSGSVTLNLNTSLVLNSTNNFTITNLITGAGSVVKQNTNMVALAGINTFTGLASVSGGVLQIGAASSLSNAYAISLNGGTLDASLIGGLTLNPAGQILNGNGTVTGNLTAATADTLNFNLSPTTNDVLNVTGSLTLNGTPTLNLAASGYKPSGTYRLINYGGSILGGGSFNLVPSVGGSETFVLDTSTAGQVNVIVTGTPHNLIWVGDGGANNWDTSSSDWSGTTNIFSTGDNVTFDDSTSYAAYLITIPAAVSPSSMTVSNDNQAYQFIGSGISTIGVLTKLGANELDFINPGNNFNGPVNIAGGTLSIGVGGNFGSLGNPSSVTNNGMLIVNLASGGQTFNGPITGSGSFQDIGGGNTVLFRGTNSYTGLTTIGDGCQLNISTSSALGTTDAGTIVMANGRLGVASLVGSMTVPEPLTVNGTGVSAAPGALYVNTVGNNVTWAGPVTIGSDSRFRAVNAGVQMNFSSTVLGTNVALECSAGSAASDTATAITFQNTLSLGSGGSLTTDGQGMIILAGNTNLCGSTTVNSGTLLVNGKLDGGTVTVNSTGTVGGSGTILGPVSVLDGGTLLPGGGGTGTLTLSNSLTLSGLSTTMVALNRTNAQNAGLLVAASVPFNGTLTVTNVGPALQPGDMFHLFAGAITGTFTATNLPTLGSPGFYWDTSLLAGQGIIKVASNQAPTPTISSPAVSSGNFTLQVAGSQIGFNYVLQATPSLSPAAWTPVRTNAGIGGTLNFTNMITPGTPQQFFRINVQ